MDNIKELLTLWKTNPNGLTFSEFKAKNTQQLINKPELEVNKQTTTKTDRRTNVIGVRVTPQLSKHLDDLAISKGQTTSSLIFDILKQFMEKEVIKNGQPN